MTEYDVCACGCGQVAANHPYFASGACQQLWHAAHAEGWDDQVREKRRLWWLLATSYDRWEQTDSFHSHIDEQWMVKEANALLVHWAFLRRGVSVADGDEAAEVYALYRAWERYERLDAKQVLRARFAKGEVGAATPS